MGCRVTMPLLSTIGEKRFCGRENRGAERVDSGSKRPLFRAGAKIHKYPSLKHCLEGQFCHFRNPIFSPSIPSYRETTLLLFVHSIVKSKTILHLISSPHAPSIIPSLSCSNLHLISSPLYQVCSFFIQLSFFVLVLWNLFKCFLTPFFIQLLFGCEIFSNFFLRNLQSTSSSFFRFWFYFLFF